MEGRREADCRCLRATVSPPSLSLSLSLSWFSICSRPFLFFSCKYRSRPDYHDKWRDFTHPRIISDTRRKEETGEGNRSYVERIYRHIVGALSFPRSPLFSHSLYLGPRYSSRYRERYSPPRHGCGDPCPSAVRDASHRSSLGSSQRLPRAFDSLGAASYSSPREPRRDETRFRSFRGREREGGL